MKNYKALMLVVIVLPLLAAVYWQEPVVEAAFVAVTDTPVPPPTNTPVPPPDTPTSTPIAATNTPAPTGTPVNNPPSDSTPGNPPDVVETPSTIPSLGGGPRMETVLLYGTLLFMLFGVVTAGWFKVWQAYRRQN